jgi:hypothetical protein
VAEFRSIFERFVCTADFDPGFLLCDRWLLLVEFCSACAAHVELITVAQSANTITLKKCRTDNLHMKCSSLGQG